MKLVVKLAVMPIVAIWLNISAAHADLGNAGPGPAPGLCAYPAVCDGGVAGFGAAAVYWYWEDFPVELNGAHRHCQWGGGATEANAQAGFSMMVQVSVGVQAPLGALKGGCGYVCPDMKKADMPNPPGGWKDAIRPTKCQPVGGLNPWDPTPAAPEDVPIAPPIGEQGAVPSIPFGQQQPQPGSPVPSPPAGAPEPPIAQQLPSVTNPVCPNPVATQTSTCEAN
jgi:hypothetical protein